MSALTLLVTVRGPLKTIDLELPSDVPTGELMPLLVEICGAQQNDLKKVLQARMNLQVEGMGAPLPLERTLSDADVCDGAVLVLQTNYSPSTPTERFTLRNLRHNR